MYTKKKFDIFLFIAVIILIVIGIIMVYSSSNIWAEYKFNDSFHYLKQQALFMIIGIIIMFIVSKIDYRFYYKKANIILGICLLLLGLVLIPGLGSVRNGSRSWFGIGSFGIQPSEAAKLGLIIFTAKYLSKNNKYLNSIKKGVIPILGIIGLFFILIMLEPDLGTALILVLSTIALLIISGVNIKFFITSFVVGVGGIIGLIIMAPYRINRIISFINPWKDPLGTGFQIIQSLYAIGPGGLLGKGFGNSIQKHFYLPEPQTDFIFSIIVEEFGFIGAITVIGLFAFIFYLAIKITLNQDDLFAKYLVFGIIFQLAFQTIMNLSVVVGLIPVTGVTLPFISYGGSSLLMSMVSIGIILNISK